MSRPRPAAIPKPRRLWPLGLYRVAGHSMLPALRPGQLLLGLRWARPRPGQIIVAWHDGRPVIKRLQRHDAAGLWLAGDNPAASTDSRHFGPVSPSQFEAVIIAAQHRHEEMLK